jgi:histidine triad (HIT) family protein
MVEYESSTKEGKCIFCEIVKDNMKTPGIFWEDEEFMAFLSLWPNTEGVSVVIPKKHYGSDVLALPDDVLQRFVIASKKVSGILMKHYEDVGRIGVIMEGMGVNHAHIKLIPMHGTGNLKDGKWKQNLTEKTEYFDNYEGYITSTEGPKKSDEEIRELSEKLKKIKL